MMTTSSPGHAKLYNADGTGRDSYVHLNNGGFTVTNLPAIGQRSGSFVPPIAIRRNSNGGGAANRPILYQTNGSGRDSYIVCNSGGFTGQPGKLAANEAYVNSLRQYHSPSLMDG